MSESLCIHCLKHEGNKTPWCPDNPGHGCTYGLGHEYASSKTSETAKPKQIAKRDKQLCTKCGLHAKNPASASSGCAHEYSS
jgi:hypothetical protein